MSRLYQMRFEVSCFNPDKEEAIKEALKKVWTFDDLSTYNGTIYADGENTLCGGETEEQFSDRAAKKIFEANGGYCGVVLKAVYVSDPPYEEYSFSEKDYQDLMARKEDDV